MVDHRDRQLQIVLEGRLRQLCRALLDAEIAKLKLTSKGIGIYPFL